MLSWGLPWRTVPHRGACRGVPWGLPVAVGRAMNLWRGLQWRAVVHAMAVEPWYAMPCYGMRLHAVGLHGMPWVAVGCHGKRAACRGHCHGNATACPCHQKVKYTYVSSERLIYRWRVSR